MPLSTRSVFWWHPRVSSRSSRRSTGRSSSPAVATAFAARALLVHQLSPPQWSPSLAFFVRPATIRLHFSRRSACFTRTTADSPSI